jgi:Flp pilus assembly pilin Flp
MLSNIRHFCRDHNGASLVEFSIVAYFLLILTAGVIEFGIGWYQWNSASKALQTGARLAAVSDPVSSDLSTLTGMENGANPGDPMPAFERVCRGDTQSCTNGGTYNASAMNALVFGRGQTACGTIGADLFPGMCDVYSRIRPENVIVTYRHTGLGFAGRPGGPVPTITLELTGVTYNYAFLSGLLGFGPVTMPPMRTTVTGEDLATTWQ